MVTVPTYDSLPSVAPVAPEVRPQQGLDRFQRQQMGAPGEAEQGLGHAVEAGAMDATRIADSMATQQNEDAAKTAATQHQQYVNNLGFQSVSGGQNPGDVGFYAMKGQDAINAAPAYLAAIQAQRDQAAQGMTQQAKNAYMRQTDGQIAAETASVQRHVMTQTMEAATQTSQARMQTADATAALRASDPDAVEQQAQIKRGEVLDEGRRNGWSPEVVTAQTQTALSKMYSDVVKKLLYSDNVAGAAKAFNAYGPSMTATDNVNIQEHLKGPLLALHAQQLGNSLLGVPSGGGGSMDAPYQPGAGYYDAVHGGEGNGVNPKSGASGPVQVIGKTAEDFHASPEGKGVDVNTEGGARQFTKWYGDQNAQKISAVTGQPATMGQVVSAHLLGPGGTTSLLTRPDEPIGNFLSSDAIKNNPGPLPGGPSMTGREAQKSIADYYAKSAGNQFAGPGAPTATSVAAATRPQRPDYEGAEQKAMAQTADDPDLQSKTISYLRGQASRYDLGEKLEREGLMKSGTPGSIPDTAVALRSGMGNVVIPELAVRRAFDQPKADAIMEGLKDAQAEGDAYNAIKFAPQDQRTAQLNTAAEALKNPDITGLADRTKEFAHLQAANKRVDEQMKLDPASYVRQEPSVAAAYSADMRDPKNVAAAVQASMAMQRQISPGIEPRALPVAQANQVVHQLHSVDPKDQKAGVGALDTFAAQYGDAWPAVMHDLVRGGLSPAYMTLASMAPGGGRTDLAAALADKAERGEKFGAAAPQGSKLTIEQTLDGEMDDFQKSFRGTSGTGAIDATRNAASTLATHYAEQGIDPTQAAKTAFARVYGDKYATEGMLRVPKVVNGQPLTPGDVLAAGAALTSQLKDADLRSTGAAAVTAAQAQNGRWMTNPDGQGATLVVPRATGGWMQVTTKDGKDVAMQYNALPKERAVIGAGTNMMPGMSE